MKSKEELDLAEREANTRLAKAMSDESVAGHGTLERAEAHSRVRQALDDLYGIEQARAHPPEEQVTLISPVGTTEVMPRSQAERIRGEFPDYVIREI